MLDRKNSPASIPQLEKRVQALEKSEGGVTREDIASFIAEMLSKYDEALKKKQDVLRAGENITIEDNVISATGGSTGEIIKLVKAGTATFTGTSAHSQSSEKSIALPVVDGYKPLSFAYATGVTSSAYRFIVTELSFTETTLTFKAFNAGSAQAVGDLDIYMLYVKE